MHAHDYMIATAFRNAASLQHMLQLHLIAFVCTYALAFTACLASFLDSSKNECIDELMKE